MQSHKRMCGVGANKPNPHSKAKKRYFFGSHWSAWDVIQRAILGVVVFKLGSLVFDEGILAYFRVVLDFLKNLFSGKAEEEPLASSTQDSGGKILTLLLVGVTLLYLVGVFGGSAGS